MNLFIISSFISTFSPFVPLLIFWRTRKAQSHSMIYLATLLMVSFLADLVGMVNSLYFKIDYINETVSYLYYFFAIALASVFYKAQFPTRFKNIFILSIVVFYSVYLYWLIANPSIITRHESKVPIGILLIAFTVSHFYALMRKMPSIYIHRVAMFWIDSGLIIYSSGTIILFAISNYLFFVLKKDQLEYWIFHNLLNTTSSILIAMGFFRVTSK